jgi:hypothetical protein
MSKVVDPAFDGAEPGSHMSDPAAKIAKGPNVNKGPRKHEDLTCGAKGTRTPGLLDANQTLFQLSYSPEMSSAKGTRYYRPARITA